MESASNLTTAGLGEKQGKSETRSVPTKSSQSPLRIRSVQVEGLKELGSEKVTSHEVPPSRAKQSRVVLEAPSFCADVQSFGTGFAALHPFGKLPNKVYSFVVFQVLFQQHRAKKRCFKYHSLQAACQSIFRLRNLCRHCSTNGKLTDTWAGST